MKEKLRAALKEAMRAKDKVRLDTIRLALSAIQYEEVEKKVDSLNDAAVVAVLQNEAKKRKESIEFAQKANRPNEVAQLTQELKILEAFLPTQLSAADLEKIIVDLKGATPGLNMGAAMKLLREKYAGQYDGKIASEVAKRVLG